VTPTECRPSWENPVSSDDPGFDRPAALDHRQHQFAHLVGHGRIGPPRIANKTCAGAVTAAIGSTLLRSIGINGPSQ
jgi:hypothetical protein